MKKFPDIRQHDDNIFKVTKQIRKDGKDITGGNNIKEKLELLFYKSAKRQAWQDHYENT